MDQSDSTGTSGPESELPTETVQPSRSAHGIEPRIAPTWLREAVIYQIVEGRFATVGESTLDHIRQLGATVVGLPSIYPSPPYPGYGFAGGSAIEPRDGILRDSLELITAAHAAGLRVVLNISADLESSADDRIATSLIEAVNEAVKLGVDGFQLRADREQSLEFWSQLAQEVRSVSPGTVLIADGLADERVLLGYDGAIDVFFREEAGLFLRDEAESAAAFWTRYERHRAAWEHVPARVMSIAGVGDDARRLKLAALLQCALPGAAEVRSGAELGHRGDDRDLLAFYRSLIFWRKKFGIARLQPSLVHAGDDGTLILRVGPWLVIINRNNDETAIDIGTGGAFWLSLATGSDVHLHGSVLRLPAWSGAILANERAR